MSKKILLICGNSNTAEEAKSLLQDEDVMACFRDYHVENAITTFKPDFILTDGTSKTRIGDDLMPIYFDPKPTAKKYGIPVYSLQWYLFAQKVKRFLFTRKALQ